MLSILITIVLIAILALQTTSNLCRNNQHVIGTWEHRPEISKKSHYCCAWDDYDWMSDQTICGNGRIYSKFHAYAGSDEYATQSGGRPCTCDAVLGRHNVSEREKYHWKPTHCHLLAWNATQFCALLGNRTILFVGDSTMQQSASTVMSMIQNDKGGCAHQLLAAETYHLTFGVNGESSWVQHYEAHRPDMTIMTVGAHLHDMGDMHAIWNQLEGQLKEVRAKYGQHIKMYWKTQNAGHANCQAYHKPVPSFGPFYSEPDYYHWNIYPEFDAVSRNRSRENNMTLIDVSPLYLRPDAHPSNHSAKVDCLHFCRPGPLDFTSNIMLTMLHTGEL